MSVDRKAIRVETMFVPAPGGMPTYERSEREATFHFVDGQPSFVSITIVGEEALCRTFESQIYALIRPRLAVAGRPE